MSQADNRIKDILIVGGGTAGWMTAALLNRFLPPGKCRITLVESADVGIIGVGEATVPPLVRYLRSLGIDEDEFMLATHTSYKLGIKFINCSSPRKSSTRVHMPITSMPGSSPAF
jgi:tryptophan halogenase